MYENRQEEDASFAIFKKDKEVSSHTKLSHLQNTFRTKVLKIESYNSEILSWVLLQNLHLCWKEKKKIITKLHLARKNCYFCKHGYIFWNLLSFNVINAYLKYPDLYPSKNVYNAYAKVVPQTNKRVKVYTCNRKSTNLKIYNVHW